jgi:hypothetical protein
MRGPWLRITRALPATALLATLPFAVACDKDDDSGRKDLEAAAAAALGTEKDKETKEREEKEAADRRKAFEERQKEEAAQNAEYERLEKALIGQPKKLPKTLDAACTELITIYEEWIKAIYFDDDGAQLTFFDSKSKNLGDVKGKCAKVGSIPAAACMTHVIQGVGAEGFPDSDKKLLQAKPERLFDKCVVQYAPEYEGPAPSVPSEPEAQ